MTINFPLDIKPWRTRIAAAAPALRAVGSLVDLSLAEDQTRSTPQAFVVSVSDTPSGQSGSGSSVLSQNLSAIVAVVFAVANQRNEEDVLRDNRQLVADSLIGWIPPGADFGVLYAGGRLVPTRDPALILWSDRYSASYLVRKEFS